ncbi:hypothetical protein CCP1ISM_7770001 [Azospirillaceae bacterium]
MRDPIGRARTLLTLLGAPPLPPALPPEAPQDDGGGELALEGEGLDDGRHPLDIAMLVRAVSRANDAPTIDRLANRVVSEIESSIHTLSAAFRAGRHGEAVAALARLEQLEAVSTQARDRRTLLRPPQPPGIRPE